jgi:two-component system nitrogen regulation response regulator NtrX
MVLKNILVIDDEENILTSLKGVLVDEGFTVETAKSGPLANPIIKKQLPDLILLDIWMPEEDGLQVLQRLKKENIQCPVIMMSGHGTIETAVKALKFGAFDFIEKPLQFDKLLISIQHAFLFKDLESENKDLKQKLETKETLLGNSEPMKKLKNLIQVTAPSNGWVMILGENGTGKELIAQTLHKQSPRSKNKFIAVNCAAIPDELIESELFGHEKGSFTGAFDRKIGKFEQASEGTLFLDEVGDMGLKLQAKILRALQECNIQRVGGDRLIELNLRVISATNKNLKECIENGEFREDLFYRLNVIPINVPPLRDRREDIPLLVEHFIKRYSKGRPLKISEATLKMLMAYPWPGNVRELKNWVERACILSQTDTLETHFPEGFASEDAAEETSLKSAKNTFEKQFILKMLSENNWNVSKTAQMIGLERSHLHKKIKYLGIETNG